MPDFALELAAGGRVAGVDEAGRGPLAGLLDDSKRLTAARRELAFAALLEAALCGEAEFGIAAASATEIGRLNILHATHLAMARAVARLRAAPDLVLVDGNRAPPLRCPVRCVVGGDGLSLSIAAASILAKVTRDKAMARLDPRWPAYGFAGHAGYPTARHRAALAEHGACPHHRRGFGPVDRAAIATGDKPHPRSLRRPRPGFG